MKFGLPLVISKFFKIVFKITHKFDPGYQNTLSLLAKKYSYILNIQNIWERMNCISLAWLKREQLSLKYTFAHCMLEGLVQHQHMLWTLWIVLPFKTSHARLTTTATDSQTTAEFWALFIIDVLLYLNFRVFCFLKFHLPLPSSIGCFDLARFG